jgi:hypothetical protein
VVTLGDVTRAGVLAAIGEFDRLGRDAFLRSTGFGPARAYFLQHDGKLYDSKAIVGYAHEASTGVSLAPGDFIPRLADGTPCWIATLPAAAAGALTLLVSVAGFLSRTP